MGANNSTCLPCKVAGANSRRSKATGGLHSQADGDKSCHILKKVSTAAEPQGDGKTVAFGSFSKSAPVTRDSSCGHQALPEQGETADQKLLPHVEKEIISVVEPKEGDQPLQKVKQQEQNALLTAEGSAQQGHTEVANGINTKQNEVTSAKGKSEKDFKLDGHQTLHQEVLQHHPHIHVPSHMLATEENGSCEQPRESRQALLSPHSCSVAHRVAAALRAAAGERAAAAAARAVEMVEEARTAQEKTFNGKTIASRPDCSPLSLTELRDLKPGARNTHDSPRDQVCEEHGQQRPSSHSNCFPHVSCLTASEDNRNEIIVRQNRQHDQGDDNSIAPNSFVAVAAKRVGEVFSTAAAAAASVASSVAAGKSYAAEEDSVTAYKSLWVSETSDFKERQLIAQMDNRNGAELRTSAEMLLDAMDSALDTINRDDFKRQASESLWGDNCAKRTSKPVCKV